MNTGQNHNAQARNLWTSGKRDEAISILLPFTDLETCRTLIWMFAEENKLEKAHVYAKKALRKGKSATDRAMLALVLLEKRKTNAAAVQAWLAIKQDKTCDLIYYALAGIYLQWRDKDRAISAIEKALTIVPDNLWYRYMLVIIHEKFGENEAALDNLNKIEARKSAQHLKERVYWSFYRLADSAEQKTAFLRQVLQFTPDDSSTRKDLIRLLLSERKADEAIQEVRILENQKGFLADQEYLLLLADCLMMTQEYDKALITYQRALHLSPESDQILQKIGDVLSIMNRQEEAIETYIRSLDFSFSPNKQYHQALNRDDRIRENRMIASERIGTGPDSIISVYFDNIRSIPDALIKLILIILVFVIAGWSFSMIRQPYPGANFEKWLDANSSLVLTVFDWGGIAVSLWIFYVAIKRIKLHPRFLAWQVFILVVYVPGLVLFTKAIFTNTFNNHGVSIFMILILWPFLLYAAIFLYEAGIEFNRKFVVRTILISLSLTIIPFLPIAFSIGRIIDSIQQMPSINVLREFKSLLVGFYSLFALMYVMVLFCYISLKTLQNRLKVFIDKTFAILRSVKIFRKQFVQDWGFSGHLIDGALWTLPCIVLWVIYSLTNYLVLCYFLVIFCLLPIWNLGIAFLRYFFDPISYKRLNVKKINELMSKYLNIDAQNQKPAILLISLTVTLALFFLFWINYSMWVLSVNYTFIQYIFFPQGEISTFDSLDWFYQSLQLMINGNFDIAVDKYTKFLLVPMSFANFLLLTLFFSQIISNFSDLGREKPE